MASDPLNFTCVYDAERNVIRAVSRAKDPARHVLKTIAFSLAVCTLAGLARTLVIRLLESTLDGYPWWATFLDSLAAAAILLIGFLGVAPRLSMFPGLRSGKLRLSDSQNDKELARLIKSNPGVFNVAWFPDWAHGSLREQKEMLAEMKAAVVDEPESLKDRKRR